ncbi:prolipoprotein diacylglyceryl transferase [Sphingobacterium spiritivorum]|uniref:Phosphatidylglycerol--prolipoprotein diacylglyceryl transferase n=1 Tax=Sphingobacterium spiritivorum ATCC 33861 TaxID=525373 RepID=D7VM77_SPHSI|nr:prolipoprotein diacylglyceryl transferase [Sphingobacterium spiritivorum]EFK58082.1 prolipoprotein diacylglyceryl transferase [Sphingobacterium spiritivorum ATCC 33861]QQT34658.1 prolipoprotein diacylglyceryl transferase [Sphingobacterium spiritivorum]WQD35542.1 prolipoprotein diacylglyceryl transferase [Sphingobacterium spiritivorum]SUJ00770.1 Prolipoprotein diacylglyceryl transferase [Sphingobacterium spiritivorum]
MENLFNIIYWDIHPEIFKIGSFGLRYYALCWLAAFAISYVLMLKIFKREGKTQEQLDQLSIYIFLGTLIGARLGHCLFYEFDYYKDHIMEIFLPFRWDANGNFQMTGFAGLASHGAAVGILTSIYLFARKTKINFMWVADRLVIVVPIAGAFVRLGNFFNSEMIGPPTDLPWAVVFKNIDNIPRHPGQLYEALAYVIIFIVMWYLYNKKSILKPGYLFGIFLVLLFGARFVLEYFKIDQEDFEKNMLFNMGQILSIPFILAGFYLIFRKPKEGQSK